MNEFLKSTIRHLLTGLAMLGTYLASAALIPADQADTVNAAAGALADPLTVILTALAVPVARWLVSLLPWLGNGSGSAVVWIATAGTLVGALPSCSPQAREAIAATPMRICYIDKSGAQVCYSTKDGLSATVDKRAGAGVTEVDRRSGT